ncbi:hypothetical protein ACIPJ2_02015 [Curtobacterium sp. NPDC090217]|uniref:hypothetical protein n=1 Tax=Curtobacterium sp. NPDC090217 TaxID=3363970 RepID=UPI00381966C6
MTMSARGNGSRSAAVLCLAAAIVMALGQVVPGLRSAPVAVWASALVLLVAALVVAIRARRRMHR